MADVFLSHAPEDQGVATELASGLRAGGFSTWTEEERSPATLERSKVVVVLASEAALADRRVTDEVVHAYDVGRPCVPVLLGLSHLEMTARQPEWRVALGAATSVEVPPEGLAAVLPRVVAGVAALAAAPTGTSWRSRLLAHRAPLVGAGAALVVVAMVAAVLLGRGDGGGTPRDGTRRTDRVIPRVTDAFSPGPLADSATTPVSTVAGRLRVTRVALAQQSCDGLSGQCRDAPAGTSFVVLTMSEWDGRDITVSDAFTIDMDRSYVFAGDARATFTSETQDPVGGTIRVTYEGLPTAAAASGLRLAWPGSSTLVLHLTGG